MKREQDETELMVEDEQVKGDDWYLLPESEYFSPRRKESQREELSRLTEQYLQHGGQIQVAQPGESRYNLRVSGGKWQEDMSMSIIEQSRRTFQYYEKVVRRMLDSKVSFTTQRMASAAGCTRGVIIGVLQGPLRDDERAQALLASEDVK